MSETQKKRANQDQDGIAADLMNPASGLFDSLVASVRKYTVAFIGLPNTPGMGSPCPCGTATLVRVGSAYYFLTAAHVWTKLQEFTNIGVTLVPNIDQCFSIPIQHLIPTGPHKPGAEEDGPDMVFLKIPDAKLGELSARYSFYPLGRAHQNRDLKRKCIEVRVLLGTPGESATLTTPANLDLTIQGVMADATPKTYTKKRFDYIDSKEISGSYGFPDSYGGFSGGGLWRIHVFYDPETGKPDWRFCLEGMAFYESPPQEGHRFVRCHGRKSIQIVKRLLRPSRK